MGRDVLRIDVSIATGQLVAAGHDGRCQAHYDGIKAFSETDFTEDLKTIGVPTLVMHGDDHQIVPIADSAMLSAKLLKNGTLKVYEKLSHGMCTTQADIVNPDLLAYTRAEESRIQTGVRSSYSNLLMNRLDHRDSPHRSVEDWPQGKRHA